jgi:alpha-L-arabinofuranosidase
MNRLKLFVCYLILILNSSTVSAQKTLVVKANEIKATIQPTMWGVFFEDINLGADGGIYAELVKNRSFEFKKPMMGWRVLGLTKTEGDFQVLNRQDANTANPRYLHVSLSHATHDIGLTNEGFRGMGIKKDLGYDFSFMFREKFSDIKIYIELVSSKGETIGKSIIQTKNTGNDWKKVTTSFIAAETDLKAHLNIWFEGDGSIDLDMISLFPKDTWKNRPGGMRADMVQLLADMKPGFIRFPGGCIVEGYDLAKRYQWKKTIGPIEERQLIISRWNTEIANRHTLDYFQTFGLGFFEYFQLAEDIGAEPLPILNCGMACQFNSSELVPLEGLDPYVKDAIDLIEFANADSSTYWGKVRASLGHKAPFHLKMLGIGNENWGPQYVERLQIFTKAIKSKYPEVKLVYSSGTDADGERFNYLNSVLRKMNADIIDEHYYRKPEWFLANAKRYDSYPKEGSKVFGGEYAAQSDHTVSINNKNTWLTALSEAAFMTGLERNADVVTMASYAPLFAHVDGWQWTPDLIWVNNLQSYGTPDYYVQKLFSTNKGTKVVPITVNNEAVTGQDSLYATAAIDDVENELVIKIVNAAVKQQSYTISLEGIKRVAAMGKMIVLKSDNLYSVNSFEHPQNIAPQESEIDIKGKKIQLNLSPYSFSVLRIKLK